MGEPLQQTLDLFTFGLSLRNPFGDRFNLSADLFDIAAGAG
jgi:hypothetical protein